MADKTLDITSIDNSIWLVKVPNFVADLLSAKDQNENIGSLKVTGKNMSIDLIDSEQNQSYQFTLNEKPITEQHLLAFLYDEKNNSYKVQGQITKNSVLMPTQSAQYQKNVINRSTSSTTRQETQYAPASAIDNRNTSHVVDFIPPAYVDQKRKASGEAGPSSSSKQAKMTPADIDKLRSKFFEAFTTNSLQSVKDLLVHIKDLDIGSASSKDRELRQLLEQYARYHGHGTSRGFWELKPEYRDKAKAVPATSSSPTDV